MPLAVFSEHVAAVIFVALSTAALVFAMTRLGWHLMLILLTDSYLAAAKLGQWTTLLTAGVFLPWISFFVLVKPQTSLPVLAGATSKKTLLWAFSGGIGLLALSLVLEPDWPMKWITEVRAAENMEPPIIRLGGFLVLLLLVRWRRPESWLVMVLAAIPQSWGWYGALPLFLIPATFGEMIFLVGFATLGSYFGALVMPKPEGAQEFFAWVGSLIVWTVYLPAVAIILRRPNAGPLPAWMRMLTPSRGRHHSRSA
jgi:hypothetical protein